jgi:hypothetical protein
MNIGLHNAFCNIIHIIYLGNLYFCTDLSEFVVSLSLYITFLLNMASLLLMIFLFFLSPNQYPNSLVLYPIKITFLYFISSLLLASKSIYAHKQHNQTMYSSRILKFKVSEIP